MKTTKSTAAKNSQLATKITRQLKAKRRPLWTASDSDEYYTPRALVAVLEREYGPFDLDPAACEASHMAPRFYTKADDGLTKPWGGSVICNPPFSLLPEFIKKAGDEVESGRSDIVVLIAPARTQRKYWAQLVYPKASEIRLVVGAVAYGVPAPQGVNWKNSPAPFATAVIVFRKGKKVGEQGNMTPLFFDSKPVKNTAKRFDIIERATTVPSASVPISVSSIAPNTIIDLGSLTPQNPYLILKGNSAKVLKGVPTGSVNLVLTSPPYTTATNIPRQNKDYRAHFDADAIFSELVRVMAPGAFLLLNEDAMVEKDGPNRGGRSLVPYLHAITLVELGLVRFDKITWNKIQAQFPGGYRQSHSTESIEVFYKPPFDSSQITILRDRPNKCVGQRVRTNHSTVDGTRTSATKDMDLPAFGRRTDIWSYSVGFGKGKSYDKHYLRKHPALMHQGLVADLIRTFVRPVQADGRRSVVLDPFGGLQTTANEALKQGIYAVGIEMSKNYCALGKRRLDETLGELPDHVFVSDSVSLVSQGSVSQNADLISATDQVAELPGQWGLELQNHTDTPQPKVPHMKTIDLSKLPSMKFLGIQVGRLELATSQVAELPGQDPLNKREPVRPIRTLQESTMQKPVKGQNVVAQSSSDILSLSQITNLGSQEIPAVVEGLIPRQSVTIIGGASGSKKTWAALDLALEASRGGIWLGSQTRKTKTLYIDLELSDNALGTRVRKLCLGKGMPLDGTNIVFKSSGAIDLKDAQCVEDLSATIRRHKPGLLFLDPLVSAAADFAENQAGAVAKVFKVLKALADEHNLAVVVIDHHAKGKAKELRGSSAKKGYADTVISMTRTDDGKSELLVTKNRHWSEDDKTLAFELTADGCVQDGLRLRVVEPCQVVREMTPPQDLSALILSKLAVGAATYRKELVALGREHGHSIKEIDAALLALELGGRVVKQRDTQAKGRGNKAHVYFLPSAREGFQEAA